MKKYANDRGSVAVNCRTRLLDEPLDLLFFIRPPCHAGAENHTLLGGRVLPTCGDQKYMLTKN